MLCGLSLVAASRGYSLGVVCRLLIAVASPTTGKWALGHTGFSGKWALGHTGFSKKWALGHTGFSGKWALWCTGFSSCSAWTLLLRGMWSLPKLGIKPMSPVLADGFFTSEPPGKPDGSVF